MRYIRNQSSVLKTFAANPVALIGGNSEVFQWHSVTGRPSVKPPK